jgi:hypothetical protein
MGLALERGARGVVSEMDTHPARDALSKLCITLMLTAHDERRSSLDQGVAEAASRLGVDEVVAETSFGNVLRALAKGRAATGAERSLIGTLGALGAASLAEPPANLALALAWVAAHTPFDPLLAAPAASRDLEARLLPALFDVARLYDEGDPLVDRAVATVATLTLTRAPETARAELLGRARLTLRDPSLVALLGEAPSARSTEPVGFDAEETSAPRSPWLTALLLVTFLLPLVAVARAFASLALRLRRPATVSVSQSGVTIRTRTELLGKTLRETESFIPASGLTKAAREVRYPSLPTYVGVGALLLGSFVGLRLVLDGARAGSPEFLSLGAVLLLAGLVIDYVTSRLPSRSADRCRLLFVPTKGRTVALTAAPRGAADRALAQLRP